MDTQGVTESQRAKPYCLLRTIVVCIYDKNASIFWWDVYLTIQWEIGIYCVTRHVKTCSHLLLGRLTIIRLNDFLGHIVKQGILRILKVLYLRLYLHLFLPLDLLDSLPGENRGRIHALAISLLGTLIKHLLFSSILHILWQYRIKTCKSFERWCILNSG